MQFDLRTDTIPENLYYHVCIIGAGAAGISLAKAFIHTGFRIALIESGGYEADPSTQELYSGKSEGNIIHADQYLRSSRTRYFGGTTNVWGGSCRPLDQIDFEKREWVPESGWPIGKADIDPYYRVAEELVEIKSFGHIDRNQYDNRYEGIRAPFFQWSPPTRFGNKYRSDIISASNIDLYLYSNLNNIRFNDNKGHVTRVIIKSMNQRVALVNSRYFIISCGGLETPRLLLNFRDDFAHGIGNQHNIVGKYFMEHPHAESGFVVKWHLKRLARFGKWLDFNRKDVDGVPMMRFFSISENVQRREELLNIAVGAWGQYHLNHELIDSDRNRDIRKFVEFTESFMGANNFLKQAYVSLLRVRAEQIPKKSNSVQLDHERDVFGHNKIQLSCNYSEDEIDNYRKSFFLINRALGLQREGRIRLDLNHDTTVIGGNHHMGTTRMNNNPLKGVVDENCKVHQISNLFIAGSSVFPTSGFANPTLTIIALSLRLAEHVKQLLLNE